MSLDQNLVPKVDSVMAWCQRLLHRTVKMPDPMKVAARWANDEPDDRAAMMWLLRYGEPMYQGWFQPIGSQNGICWFNSLEWSREAELAGYVYAYAEGMVVERVQGGMCSSTLHGWNLHQGHVHDRTCGTAPQIKYFGMAFSGEFLRFCYFMAGCEMSLLLQYDKVGAYLENYGEERLRLRAKKGPG